ncbi:MAG TPA: pyridoxal-phosphate dependent enzyme [Pyrinomonadaceae bacterium]|nr:pyridoxal-phosphate dependent enzyme [Pyrinomonadaceae bacterium]
MISILEKYKEFLPLNRVSCFDSLGEGNTPLVRSSALGRNTPLFFKMEQLNPTGSFKDRFASVETALIKEKGIKTFMATSSGNTGSALAAYSARHGIRCLLFVNEITPQNKLDQMLVYGAEVFRVKNFGVTNGSSAPIFERLRKLAEECNSRLVISAYKYSPEGMEGVKTIAYELVEQLGSVPDQVFVPVGGGGLLSAVWRGFLDMKARKLIDSLPRINAVQPVLNDTVVTPLVENAERAREVKTTTAISGLAVQVDIDASLAVRSVRESAGSGYLVSDEDAVSVQEMLSEREGIFVEPAGAVSAAGYLKALSLEKIGQDETAVCVLTGHGLKTAAAGGTTRNKQVKCIGLSEIVRELVEK